MAKTRVLVTGAAGAIGREVVAELGRRVERFDVRALALPKRAARARLRPFEGCAELLWGDVRDPVVAARAVEDVDAILHLAAVIPPRADRHPRRATTVNVAGTAAVLGAAQATGRPIHFVYTSSVSVYGDRLADPWIGVGDPLRPSPHDHYAVTKVQAEELVRASGLPWTVLRLSAVLSPDMHVDPLMFHMPLDTPFEIVTSRDCAYALVETIGAEALHGRVFNVGGGPRCRTTYRECLDRVLAIAGLGEGFFPPEAFARGNFHCGYFRDSDELQGHLGFQRDGLEDYYDLVAAHTHPLQRSLAAAARPLIRWFLLETSEPYRARRLSDPLRMERFRL